MHLEEREPHNGPFTKLTELLRDEKRPSPQFGSECQSCRCRELVDVVLAICTPRIVATEMGDGEKGRRAERVTAIWQHGGCEVAVYQHITMHSHFGIICLERRARSSSGNKRGRKKGENKRIPYASCVCAIEGAAERSAHCGECVMCAVQSVSTAVACSLGAGDWQYALDGGSIEWFCPYPLALLSLFCSAFDDRRRILLCLVPLSCVAVVAFYSQGERWRVIDRKHALARTSRNDNSVNQ